MTSAFRAKPALCAVLAIAVGVCLLAQKPSANAGPTTSPATATSAPTTSPANQKADRIRHLMEVSGAAINGVQVMNTMIGNFKKNPAFRDVPDEFWEEFKKEVNPEDLVEVVVPIYDKYFTPSEIEAIIAFYETPIGKKLIQMQPQVTQDAMAAGRKWGEGIAAKVTAKLKARNDQMNAPKNDD